MVGIAWGSEGLEWRGGAVVIKSGRRGRRRYRGEIRGHPLNLPRPQLVLMGVTDFSVD